VRRARLGVSRVASVSHLGVAAATLKGAGAEKPVPSVATLCQTLPMSQGNPLRVFVTHAWQTGDEYLRLFEYLESARNFFYRNYSTPDRPPSGDKEAEREDLRRQIAQVEVVIALSSVFEASPDIFNFEILFAQASNKPVILMKPFGAKRELPKALTDQASEVVDWDERALVDAIRRQARHEDTTRWDTIEFKLE
jgi:hypothetical protein